jgi:glycosyltransferase involved in cell wall biosynthesis
LAVKVIVNAVSAFSGGAATYVENLARELAASTSPIRFRFFVPPTEAERMTRGPKIRAVATKIGSAHRLRRLLWDQVTLRRMVLAERADVLLSSSDFGMLKPPCKQLLLLRNPLFFSQMYRETILPQKSFRARMDFKIRSALVARSVESADLIVTASRSMLADVRARLPIPDAKCLVNHFGAPLERFASGSNGHRQESTRALQVLYVSEYFDHKNLGTLLRALIVLRQRGQTGFRLVSTADPDQGRDVEIAGREQDKVLASHPALADCLHFTGAVPYTDIPRLYASSDIFVFPSLVESFGHPLVEAMASGLPVIASDIPVCREICGDAALYFDPLDPEALAQTLAALMHDGAWRSRLGRAGRMRAVALFDWRRHVCQLIAALERLVTTT